MVRETRYLLVGNLPENVTEEEISEYFKRWVLPWVRARWRNEVNIVGAMRPTNPRIIIKHENLLEILCYMSYIHSISWYMEYIRNKFRFCCGLFFTNQCSSEPRLPSMNACNFYFTFLLILWNILYILEYTIICFLQLDFISLFSLEFYF